MLNKNISIHSALVVFNIIGFSANEVVGMKWVTLVNLTDSSKIHNIVLEG